MKEKEDDDLLSGRIEIDDSYLGGRNKGGKRGRGSENKLPNGYEGSLSSTEKGI